MWMRGHPELRNQDPNAWSLHESHNSEVDKAATHAATRACRNAPQPFNLLPPYALVLPGAYDINLTKSSTLS